MLLVNAQLFKQRMTNKQLKITILHPKIRNTIQIPKKK